MKWINPYGLIFMCIIMIPNIVYAVKCKDGFENLWSNKFVNIFEQIGRFGSFALMVIIIPNVNFGFSSDETFAGYLIVDSILIAAYCLIWIICFRKNTLFRALALSIIPSVIFLFSGIISNYIPLIVAAAIFAPCHILISCKNTILSMKKQKTG